MDYNEQAKIVENLVNRLRKAYEDVLVSLPEEHKGLMKDYPQIPSEFSSDAHKMAVSLMPALIKVLHFVQAGPVKMVQPGFVNQPKRDIQWAANGAKKAIRGLTSPKTEESEKRLGICKGCDQWTGKSCKVCGCFVTLKVRIPEEKCPLGKW